jgi:hypothetical protein
MNECWGTRTFTDRELKAAEDDLKATRFTTFTQNFLRFNVLPGVLDWFDDYSAVVNNARQAARIASAGGAAGILFDVEAYSGSLWNYAKQKGHQSKSFAAYATQAESRGAAVMRAFQEGWKAGGSNRPLVVFQTFGYSLPRQQASGDRAKLAAQEYGLLAPFMDGMYAAADDGVTIVDGFEFAYGYKDEAAFKDARELVLGKLPAFVKDQEAYLKHTSLGIGLWMDYDWRTKGWDEKDASKNYFKPADFERSVALGLKYADRYVWVYTEKPKWWTPAGAGPTGVAPAYIDAVRRVKTNGSK